jgi:hypothetical protein
LRVANAREVADTGDEIADTGLPQPSALLRRNPTPADEPNSFQTKGCAVDGGLACPDADHGDRRP